MSEYYKVQHAEHSKDVIVAFSAINVPKAKFSMSNAFAKIGINVIYCNCKDNLYYLDGIPGLGSNPVESAKSLKKIISDIAGEEGKILTVGSSMGGYGALLYGALLDADLVLSIGAKCDIFNLSSLKNNINKEMVLNKEPDILSLMNGSHSSYEIIYGDTNFEDLKSSLMYKNVSSTNIKVVSKKEHVVVNYLNKKYGVSNLVKQLLLTGGVALDKSALSNIVDCPSLIDSIYALQYCGKNYDYEKINRNLLLIVDLNNDPTILYQAYYGLALLEFKEGDYSKALLYINHSLSIKPNIRAFLLSAEIFFNEGKYNESIKAAHKAIKEYDDSFESGFEKIAYHNIEKSYIKQRRFQEARSINSKALTKYPGYKPSIKIHRELVNYFSMIQLEKERLIENDEFDQGFYLKRYADVARSSMDPLDHYVQYGRHEGRLAK